MSHDLCIGNYGNRNRESKIVIANHLLLQKISNILFPGYRLQNDLVLLDHPCATWLEPLLRFYDLWQEISGRVALFDDIKGSLSERLFGD